MLCIVDSAAIAKQSSYSCLYKKPKNHPVKYPNEVRIKPARASYKTNDQQFYCIVDGTIKISIPSHL